MQSISLSKLNIACSTSFQRAVIRQVKNLDARQVFNKRSYSLRSCRVLERNVMASFGLQAMPGDRYVGGLIAINGNVGDSTKAASVFFDDTSLRSSRKAGVSLRYRGAFSFSLGAPGIVGHKGHESRLFIGLCSRQYHVSCSASNAAADVPLEVSVIDEQQVITADSSAKSKHVSQRTLKLKSGSYYLPHPEKVKTGGEDAHFICEEKQVIGVADGVGGWAEVGVDAGVYARLLMTNSVTAIKEESKGSVDPAKVLEKAHANTKVMGSSTACIVALTDQGINAINLGDSAFIVIRDGSTVFRSPAQQYGFNFPYQLANSNEGDLPSSGQVFTFPVASGDVLVAGTDGLFDNMFDNEIAALVVQAMRTGLEPQITAQNIASQAQQRALDTQRQTPFSTAAHDAGLRYMGGKLDDITVVVSYIAGEN